MVTESIPWLIAKKRISEAKHVLRKAARWNNVDLPSKFMDEVSSPTSKVRARMMFCLKY